jgi:hypothetical protein
MRFSLRVGNVIGVVVCSWSAAIHSSRSESCRAASSFVHVPILHRSVASTTRVKSRHAHLLANDDEDGKDTVRVRIWRVLASGEEMTLKQLGSAVGERRLGDLKAHLTHVEKQAKTLGSKSPEWRIRRGLSGDNVQKINKMRLKIRRGDRNEVCIRLV